MTRKSLSFAPWIIAILALGLPYAFSQERPTLPGKVGVVHLSKLFKGYSRAQVLEAQAAQEEKSFTDRLEALAKSIKDLKEELGNLDPNGELYGRMRRDLTVKQSELEYMQTEEKNRLQRHLDELTQDVLHDLEDAVRTFGAQRGFTAILRVDEAPEGVDRAVQFSVTTVLYHDPSIDVTDEVVAWLNANPTQGPGQDQGGK